MKIAHIKGREIYDSKGNPTLECVLILEDGSFVTASVPSGISTGSYEAYELRDGDQSRLHGLGVLKAIENLETIIAPVLVGKEPSCIEMDVELIALDGTQNKAYLGANTLLAASMAIIRAQSLISGTELYELIAFLMDYNVVTLPFPLFNIINGGAHADNGMCIQEIMIMPVGFERFSEGMIAAQEVFYMLKDIIKAKGKRLIIGAEGGLAPEWDNEIEPFDTLMEALVGSGHDDKFKIAIDVAASQFYNKKTQYYDWGTHIFSTAEMIGLYADLCARYPIYSIEDGLAEDDWHGWSDLMETLGHSVQIVGDDLLATNPHRIAQAIEEQSVTAAIIKPNQIGTVTEALQAIKLCQAYELNAIVSHRSGETEDTFIADMAVGANVGQFKAGGCSSGQSMAKYNQLLRIEDELLSSRDDE